MITVNGSPKTGTHLLKKTVMLMSKYDVIHDHIPYPSKINGKHIHITRYPRNVLVSWVRFRGMEVTKKNILSEAGHIIDEMSSYVGWLKDKDTLNVKFESLLTDERVIKEIADYINKPLPENAFNDMWGGTYTFTGKLSNWREHWNDIIESEWIKKGGIILENSLGYSENDPVKVRKKP